MEIAYRQTVRDEERKNEIEFQKMKMWVDKLDNLFKVLYIFVDPKRYEFAVEMKEIEKLREEIKPEEFGDLWASILETIPEAIVVEDDVQDPATSIPMTDKETDQVIAGFVSYRQQNERGNADGNG